MELCVRCGINSNEHLTHRRAQNGNQKIESRINDGVHPIYRPKKNGGASNKRAAVNFEIKSELKTYASEVLVE